MCVKVIVKNCNWAQTISLAERTEHGQGQWEAEDGATNRDTGVRVCVCVCVCVPVGGGKSVYPQIEAQAQNKNNKHQTRIFPWKTLTNNFLIPYWGHSNTPSWQVSDVRSTLNRRGPMCLSSLCACVNSSFLPHDLWAGELSKMNDRMAAPAIGPVLVKW